MMKNIRQVNFDSVAPVYDLLARLVFGNAIRQAQQHYLSLIPESSSILIIGGGTGWILTDVLSLNKNIQHITYLEASGAMLDQARKKLSDYKDLHAGNHFPSINFIQGTEDNVSSDNFYDVIITGFFLDLFNDIELQEVMKKLSLSLHSAGIWLFSDFNICRKTLHAWWQWLLIKGMYWFFRITCRLTSVSLPDFDKAFQKLGFVQMHSYSSFKEMMVARVYRKGEV